MSSKTGGTESVSKKKTGKKHSNPEERQEDEYRAEKGEVIDDRYEMIEYLDKGHFSTVWKAKKIGSDEYVAIKIQRRLDKYTRTALEEIEFLKKVSHPNILQLLDHFYYKRHMCLVFPCANYNLLDILMKKEKMTPERIKNYTRQILSGLEYLHDTLHIIHTDLKPENILIIVDQEGAEHLLIGDLGNACHLDDQRSTIIQSANYRSFEIIINSGYDTSADMWSVGCILFEMQAGVLLFEWNSDKCTDKSHTPDYHLLETIISVLGPPPKHIAKSGENSSLFFNKKGQFRGKDRQLIDISTILTRDANCEQEYSTQLSAFILAMLNYKKEKRITARDALAHEFLSEIPITNADVLLS